MPFSSTPPAGGIVNEAALAAALRARTSFSAAVDVFVEEPYEGELSRLENCLLSCHMGSGNVADVVAQYARDVADSNVETLSTRADREGDGRLRFEEFSAMGDAINAAPMCGSEARFQIEYLGKAPLRNIHISMGFYNMYGDGALYLSNDLVNRSFEEIPAAGTLVCKFDRLLLPGSYSVNLYCTVNGSCPIGSGMPLE